MIPAFHPTPLFSVRSFVTSMANIFGGSMGMASQSSNIVQTLVQTVKQLKIIKPETYKLSKLLLLVCGPLSVFKLTFQVSSMMPSGVL